jgi:hypothetical protein
MKMNPLVCKALFLFAMVLPASAIGQIQLERTKERAVEKNKLIAFVVMQECQNLSCPVAVSQVAKRNGSVKHAVPSKGVIIVKLDPEDLEKSTTPECVRKNKSLPSVTITNAACTEVIDRVGPEADKERIAQMESKIAAAIK